jgi:predicted enzyme related to lactoylglutathione lyase
MKAKVSHFEIPAVKVERARRFYSEAFGWEIVPVPEMDYNMVHTAQTDEKGMLKETGTINGGMMKRSREVKHPVITIEVDDIDEALRRVKEQGGRVAVNKMPVGDMGFSAYFEDPEGNLMGLFQSTRLPQ